MRVLLPALAALTFAGAAAAQPRPSTDPTTDVQAAERATRHPTGVKPLDKGPYTPEANKAYQGGGVVLQGAPGAPAPTPQPTSPGQAPRNAVPQ